MSVLNPVGCAVTVTQLVVGHCTSTALAKKDEVLGQQRLSDLCSASCSVALVEDVGKGVRVLVDCGGVGERQKLLSALRETGLKASDITHLVLTHWHADHVGNIDLFPGTTLVDPSEYEPSGGEVVHEITPEIHVVAFDGHSTLDLVVMVSQQAMLDEGPTRVVCVSGDIFESGADIADENLWMESSANPTRQLAARGWILERADVIIPGHGCAFTVKAPPTITQPTDRPYFVPSIVQLLPSDHYEVTLVRGGENKNILINSGGPEDRAALMKALAAESIDPHEITHVVVTKPCRSTCYSLSLFPDTMLFMGEDFALRPDYYGKITDERIKITDAVIIMKMNGVDAGSEHSLSDRLCVLVDQNEKGVTILTGSHDQFLSDCIRESILMRFTALANAE